MARAFDAAKYARLMRDLRTFLKNPITLEQSLQVLKIRIENRSQAFLGIIRTGIYANLNSPYLALLQAAGCEPGDIEASVRKDGIESTLLTLRKAGVYLSFDEFKKSSEVVRGSRHFRFKPSDFDNPNTPSSIQKSSSGSRSGGNRTTYDIRNLAETAYRRLPLLAANRISDQPVGIYKPILPASSGISNLLWQWKVGKPAVRWFTPVNEKQVRASFRDSLALRYILYGSLFWGARLARPEYVDLNEAFKVARWMADTRAQSGGCCLITSVSPAVKVCHAAVQNGLDLRGTHFSVSGEPLTEAKYAQITAAGATVSTRYTMSESSGVGAGCCYSDPADDVHHFHDATAIIQQPKKIVFNGNEITVNAFLCTTLLPTAPRILLNVESDDYGIMENHSCDCIFGQLGYNTHIHHIRSYAKLTGVGMTIIDTDLVRILEEVLPQKYGGSAADYQMLEEEDSEGRTHLYLLISPSVGSLAEDEVITQILAELRRIPRGGRLAAGVWGQDKTLSIKRMNPISNSGKVMTLQLRKSE
jgi:hypothetical protein